MTAHSTSRVALITGGSRGLGRATALRIAADGIDPIITYRTHPDEADAVAEEVRSMGRNAAAFRLDVADIHSLAAFADTVRKVLADVWGREDFDFLVNNAGIGSGTAFADVTEEEFDALMNVHLKGVFFLTQSLLPLVRDGGRIVNVSTALTRYYYPGSTAYAMMKGGQETLTRYLAAELGPRRISVNTVAPGATATDFAGGVMRTPQLREALGGRTAMGRMGEPEDIAGVIAALLGPDIGWVTGQRLEASGGIAL
ncbi:SDR family oxidoreductase [Streptomyces sp. NPDC026672]|uniref:SDR family NAD(P)-dependent oxidoreductase n=1 Tax=unclassified Streptomyces TaxID=2593676 RepID=UPI0033E9B4E3